MEDSPAAKDPPLSKNRLKKLMRDQKWEEERAMRKVKRKEKLREKKQQNRAAHEGTSANDPDLNTTANGKIDKKGGRNAQRLRFSDSIQLPVSIILDCGFDNLMTEKEHKSLAAQITRSYSDNHRAPFCVHLAISSFGGYLKGRFDSILSGHYSNWKNVRFLDGDFVEVAAQSKDWMKGEQGGKVAGALSSKEESQQVPISEQSNMGEVVYLTSDSPDTLTELKPYSTYIVGGLVDRNRHKGICYKRAMDRGMKTAKLPIGDYIEMASRFVLATNHVSEIMVRWLELGDWGEAFLRVMPKRKGGVLKSRVDGASKDHGANAMFNGDDETELEDRDKEEDGNEEQEEVREMEAPASRGGDGCLEANTGGAELDIKSSEEEA